VIATPFISVALMTPLPEAPRVAPLPTTIAAAVFVADVIPEKSNDVAVTFCHEAAVPLVAMMA
jgi:hypothetical protein